MSGEAEQKSGAASYAFKPSLAGSLSEFTLHGDAIEWRTGNRALRVPYRDIRKVRLSFRPVTLQPHRFTAEIWSTSGVKLTLISTSWRTLTEIERHDEAYIAFLAELHRRLAAAAPAAAFRCGSPPLLYWPGVALFIGLCVAATAVAIGTLHADAPWLGLMIAAGVLAWFLWQMANFLRRNRPGSYSPDALPRQVLP